MARHADACPYARPFADDFRDCPAYQRVEFMAVDSQYRPLGRHNTCRHLEAKSLGGRIAGFYGACALGDATARERWVARVDERRLEGIRAVGLGLGEATREVTRELWHAKSEQLRASRTGKARTAPGRRMRALAREYERQARGYLEANAAQLEALDLPVKACVELVVSVLEFWVTQMSMEEAYQVPDPVLERFPSDVRLLIRPHAKKAS
ncbi:MAG: hypothetical protein ABI838_00035 [Chloroflexota bacterium]